MTDNRAVHIIDLLQRILNIQDGTLKTLITIKSDTALILLGVLSIQGNTAAAVTALNSIITLINTSNTNLSNIIGVLNQVSADLAIVKTNLDTLVQQGTNTYNQLIALTNKVDELKVSQDAFYAAILKYEDTPAVSGDAGIQTLSVRQDTPTSSTSNNGDYQSIKTDSLGVLYINSFRSLPFNADYLAQTNPDGNGYFQTITYRQGGAAGTIVRTITLTFNAGGDVLTYLES